MIEKVVTAFVFDYAGVVGVGVPGIHDVASVSPRPCWTVAGGVTDFFVAAAVGGVDHVVGGATFVDPWPLDEIGQRGGLDASRVTDHVAVQPHVLQGGVAPVHVGLSVIVDEDSRVDVARCTPRQVRAKWVSKRADWVVGNRDTNSGTGVVVQRHIQEIGSVSFDGLRRPGAVVAPTEGADAGRGAVVGPVHHVGCGVEPPVVHGVEVVHRDVFVMGGVDVQPVSEYYGRRVCCVVGLDEGIFPARPWTCIFVEGAILGINSKSTDGAVVDAGCQRNAEAAVAHDHVFDHSGVGRVMPGGGE